MAKKVDIIDVMLSVYKGELKIEIQNGYFLLENIKSGERVRLNETDAVEVVRCKDCKWYNEPGEHCRFWHGIRHPEHYCGEGERKTEE